jgi:hypothetical protein
VNSKDVKQAKMLANKYGSANCWTGSTGSLAAELKRCLNYIEGLNVDRNEVSARPGSEVLLEAFRLVNQDRGEQYGPPHEDYAKVAEIFSSITGVKLSVEQAIMFPLAMKLARIRTNTFDGKNGWHNDSVIDAAGYLACLSMAHVALAENVE